MNWADIITNVAKAVDRVEAGAALSDMLSRAILGETTDVGGRVFAADGRSVPFLDDLDHSLRARHTDWSAALVGEARALLLVLPALLGRLRRTAAGHPLPPERIRAALERIETLASQVEGPASGSRTCRRCGSARVDVQKTTFSGTNHYEQHCEACGNLEDWDDGISLGEAMRLGKP